MTFNLGNLADSLSTVGSGIMKNMMFYGAAKMALHNSSWGYGGCGGSIWIRGCGCGGSYPGYMGGSGIFMANTICSPQMLNMAFMQGRMQMMQYLMQAQASRMTMYPSTSLIPQNTDAPSADAVSQDQDTTLGENFEKAEKEGTNFDFIKPILATETDEAKRTELYNSTAQAVGKSLLMNIDKTSGNSDGYISLTEFIEHETAGMEETKKTAFKTQLQRAYSQLDQNGDGKVDWKELSAMVTTYDSGLNGTTHDGEISIGEFNANGNALLNGQLSARLRSEYTRMFGQEES